MKVVPATEGNIRLAACILKKGGIVVIPTETVYGVAADALNPDAVRKVFAAKGRPADNPLIVHVASVEQAKSLTSKWTKEAQALAERFWPGPLTLVLLRAPEIPSEVVAGLDTVAVRMPSHPVALALIQECGRPLAAPSANRFMHLSATCAENVDPDLIEHVELVLDGGPCEIGLESTVVDVSVSPPRILRPGAVSRGGIQAALGMPLGSLPPDKRRKSPGMYRRHYAPVASVKLVKKLGFQVVGLTFDEARSPLQIKMPLDPAAYGAALYAALHRLDQSHPETIFVEEPPSETAWEAVWDRLRKACGEAA